MKVSAPVLQWLVLVGLVFLIGILLPGYLVMRAFDPKSKRDFGQVVVYSVGISLVVIPLAIYWSNFLGLAIDRAGVIISIAIAFFLVILAQFLLRFLERRFTGSGLTVSKHTQAMALDCRVLQ